MPRREGAPPARARKSKTASEPRQGDAGNPSPEAEMTALSTPHSEKRPPGRPPGGRAFVARHSVRLDAAQQEALMTIAGQRGQSVHSLLLEAVDAFIRDARPLGLS